VTKGDRTLADHLIACSLRSRGQIISSSRRASSLYGHRVASPSLPMASTRLSQGGHDQTVGRRSGGFDFPLSERSRSLRASERPYFAFHQHNIWSEASTKRTSFPKGCGCGLALSTRRAIFVLPKARHRRHLGRSHLVEISVKSGSRTVLWPRCGLGPVRMGRTDE
jgi:hypothetical protein